MPRKTDEYDIDIHQLSDPIQRDAYITGRVNWLTQEGVDRKEQIFVTRTLYTKTLRMYGSETFFTPAEYLSTGKTARCINCSLHKENMRIIILNPYALKTSVAICKTCDYY